MKKLYGTTRLVKEMFPLKPPQVIYGFPQIKSAMGFLLTKGHVENELALFRTNVLDQVFELKKQIMGEPLPQGPDVGRITRSMADMYG